MESKKSTVLLTVIAVATLLVAVVGATFAYFTAQGGNEVSKSVTVTTETASSSSFTASALTLSVSADEFTENAGNKANTATATASFTASSEGTDSEVCYTVTLAITSNSFAYSSTNTDNSSELVITVNKGGSATTSDGTDGYISGSSYITGGTDLLVLDVTGGTTGTYSVPTTLNGSTTTHSISASAGASAQDTWIYEAVFYNLDVDQNDNAGDSFVATITFDTTTCS